LGKGNKNNNHSWAKTVRDIVVASINKGQLPILGVISIFLVILIRIPPQDLSTILSKVIEHLVNNELWSYILLFIVCSGWFIHAKIMRTNFTRETNRMSAEKTKLQNQLTKKKFKSSEQ